MSHDHNANAKDLGSRAKRAFGRVKSAMRALRGNSETAPSTNPFGNALREASERPDGVLAALTEQSLTLGPLVKRRQFPELENVPENLTLGWAQLTESDVKGFSLGVFTDRDHFAQIAFADRHGRVFVGSNPRMDIQEMQPQFVFGKEREIALSESERLDNARNGHAIVGGIAGRDIRGRMMWLASWLKSGNRYTLEQSRANLSDALRKNLEYRDAITIAFFATYMLPQINGLLIGFGSGNIFRRLNREAPIGAIRHSVRDTMEARAHGMRASGLEDHFADLMNETGVLDGEVPGLEAEHGSEPLHLYSSPYSGGYFLTWNQPMMLPMMLKALRIEGNLNRFAAVSAWLERNAAMGLDLTEDTVTRAEAAQIDQRLLENPAIVALGAYEGDDERLAVVDLVRKALEHAAAAREHFPNPVQARGSADGEWIYRQTFSSLLRRLRLPYRFDVEFRSNLAEGKVAIGFTTAGTSLMPATRYDEQRHTWRELSDADRAQMSASYNLRVGLMMAALAFGTDARIQQVSLHVDSLGIEEAVAEQDSAIAQMMSQALIALDHLRSGDISASGSKADPKDGDVHGEISRPSVDDDLAMNLHFEDLMGDIDIDSMAFAEEGSPDGEVTFEIDDPLAEGSVADNNNPMRALEQNPTVRTVSAVTFTRDEFLSALNEDGLERPQQTYRRFNAVMDLDESGAFQPVKATFDLHDAGFSPAGAQEEPEFAARQFSGQTADIFGATNSMGLAIQREDLLQYTMSRLRLSSSDASLDSVAKAQNAMRIIDDVRDPELTALSTKVTSSLIDGKEIPDLQFTLAKQLDKERMRARDMLFTGRVDQAIEVMETAVEQLDNQFKNVDGVPRYFNSYAERVAYNRLFATPGERTVLIPDNLFHAHMELADILDQLKGSERALPHLNAMVSYAPAYPLAHMRLSVQLAHNEDWASARAACLNALRVALDRDDAAFAYYRFAYAEWMMDHFDVAAAAYIMSDHIAPGQIMALDNELHELMARADSQCIPVPDSVDSAAAVLRAHDVPVWPHTEVADIMRDAARVCVDEGMFVPARTLSVAVARMDEEAVEGIDVVQGQFLRSLSA